MAREIKGFKLDAPRGQVLREVQQAKSQRIKSQKQARQARASGERQESFIFGTLLNTTTYMIIFLLLLFGSSINVYQSNPQKYSWLDLNDKGEIVGFREETYDVTVSYNLDTPQDDLNGYSLREVFEDENLIINNDFSDGLNNWILTSNPTVTIYDDYVEIYNSSGSGYARIEQRPNVSVGDQTYVTINAKFTGAGRIQYYNGNNVILGGGTEFQQLSALSVSATQTDTYFQIGILASVDTLTTIKGSIYAINITDLGINQTKDEMDYWYSEYQRLQENRIEDMKYLGGLAVSSWVNVVGILTTLGDVSEAIYDITPIGLFFGWLADIDLV